MKKYCPVCGKETVKLEKEGFNTENGERNFIMTCPDTKCVVGCESRGLHSYVKKDASLWDYVCNRSYKCLNCGEEVWGGFY